MPAGGRLQRLSGTPVTTSYDERLAALQGAGRLPSVAAALALGGTPAWSGSLTALPGDTGTTVATAYRIGSISKTLTAVLVLQAARRGAAGAGRPDRAVRAGDRVCHRERARPARPPLRHAERAGRLLVGAGRRR
ncbi:serine hydrolase [Nocardioides convexus]|uniref:serine hydrolase n=1 Tax=Nocardioides convexus TaxID=2712224 RepID=UPI0024184E05|nr:serine hydrolase [Nocardioides convexus]